MPEITISHFIAKTGNQPIHDDMERVNCKEAGSTGHMCCGWCTRHDEPVFQCGCFFPEYRATKDKGRV